MSEDVQGISESLVMDFVGADCAFVGGIGATENNSDLSYV
jgi:hypothetical protein